MIALRAEFSPIALGRTRFFREPRAFLVHPAGKAVFSYPEAL
jgi:hypothetical protein